MIAKTLVVVIAAAFFATTYAAECPGSELIKITPLAANALVSGCTRNSGFQLFPANGNPNDATLLKMCKSSDCRGLIDAIRAVNPSNCELASGLGNINLRQLVDGFSGNCARLVPASHTSSLPC